MGFALRASYWLFKFDPVKFVGSASQHKFIPDEFVFACPRKSNQKKRHPNQFAPSGFPQHSPLPTGRPDSPSGLDMTKSGVLPDFPYQSRMLRQTSWGQNLTSVSLDVTKWNPGMLKVAEKSRITLRFIRACEAGAKPMLGYT
jgi:hypothetical protein